jgi:hypothetical protein
VPRLVLGEQLGRRPSPWLILEIDIGQLLPAVIAHDEAGGLFFDGPWWREAATFPYVGDLGVVSF